MVQEAFTGIALALGISYVVLACATANVYVSFWSVFVIFLLVIDVIGRAFIFFVHTRSILGASDLFSGTTF